MKAKLVTAASNVVRNPQILVNMVSRRVRHLTLDIVRWSNSRLGSVMLISH